jgi:hypothetical protein
MFESLKNMSTTHKIVLVVVVLIVIYMIYNNVKEPMENTHSMKKHEERHPMHRKPIHHNPMHHNPMHSSLQTPTPTPAPVQTPSPVQTPVQIQTPAPVQTPAPAQQSEPAEYDDEIWGVSPTANLIYKSELPCLNDSCNWQQIPGGAVQVANGPNDVWALSPSSLENEQNIWRCDKPCDGQWISVPGHLQQISVGNNSVWGVTADNSIYTCPNTKSSPCTGNWTKIPGALNNVSL